MPKALKCLLFLFIFYYSKAEAQGIIEPAGWNKIETGIRNKDNLQDLKAQLLGIKSKAIAENNDAALARSLAGLLQITDVKTEDSLFFKNAAFMDSILSSTTSSDLLKSIMHLFLARRIYEFEMQFYYRHNKNLISAGEPRINYAAMDKKELDSLIFDHLDKSIKLSKQLKQSNLDDLIWLSSNPLIFLFRPGYTDLLYSERIFMCQRFMVRHSDNTAVDWLSESPDEFIQKGDEIKTFNETEEILFCYFHDWIQYHLPEQPEAAYFIETLARKYFYQNTAEDSANTTAYEKYLNALLSSPYQAVSAHAVYQLCKFWKIEGDKYNPTLPSTSRYSSNLATFDSSARLYYNKTLELLERFKNKLDSFSYLKTDLLNMREAIQSPGLIVTTQDVQTPGMAFPALLQFRNISHLYTRIIRIGPLDLLPPDNATTISRFIQLPAFAEKTQTLVRPDDHQWHNLFVKWDPLPAGRFIILYSDTIISGVTSRLKFIDLSVTNIAVVNNDQRIFVLNRKTGFPLPGAKVLPVVHQKIKSGNDTIFVLKTGEPRIVNEQGYTVKGEDEVSEVAVYAGSDSITASVNKTNIDIPSGLYDSSKYNDLAAYYKDNIHVNIFTDRSIYRPGQTVFYKGIFTYPDPKTGELKILNFQKLRLPFFKNLYSKVILKFNKPKTEITIDDPFNRTMDSIRVTPNKFGSFSGSFTIPKDAATGAWNFDSEDFDLENRNSGKFQVEEYKRPTFKIILRKPNTELQLGDSFNVLLKTRSFAGAPLSHVLLKYRVYRSSYFSEISSADILVGESISDDQGEFKLVVLDSSLNIGRLRDDKKISVEYRINVEALDETGESHEKRLNFYLSNWPVKINIPMPEVLERKTIAPVYISMNNEFSGPVKKPLEIAIYKLSKGRESQYDHDWPQADLWIESREQWQTEFPDINFNGHSQTEPEKTLIYKTSLPADADKRFVLPANLLISGLYKIEAVCRVDGQTRGKDVREFSVYDKNENSIPVKDFEWLPVNSVTEGDTLKLITGNKENDYFSIYHMAYLVTGKKGVSNKFDYIIRTDKKGLNKLDYPIPMGITGNLTLTHLYIQNNQLYRSEHEIYIQNRKNANPDIFIEKYRTQISPGEKETFMVSIKTKNPQEAAELMTTMYDASLDELEPHHWEIPRNNLNFRYESSWNRSITFLQKNFLYQSESGYHPYQRNAKPLWWISSPYLLSEITTKQFMQSGEMYINGSQMLQGRASGLSITSNSLNDVVVVGYGISRALSVVNTIRIQGVASLSGNAQPMIILDGVRYLGDLNQISPASIYQGIILKGADAAALYGADAARGVLILSTHGPVVLPQIPETPLPPLVIRKNFSESAFFYPMIYAGKDGLYSFSFTLPETVTEWKWKLLAHTRNAGFAYLEKSLFSQLPLMVQPSMPRFLYRGDKIVLKTRITNLDTADLNGHLTCTIEDFTTGEDLSRILLNESSQSLNIKHASNLTGSFTLTIPSGLLHPLRIRISAATNKFSDGEEHIIPILSKKFLLSQTVSFNSVTNHPLQTEHPVLPEDAEPYGLSLYIAPKPQATLMNALSYLAFDPFGCSEQTLNKMLAFSMAVQIARRDSLLLPQISKTPDAENPVQKVNDEPAPDEQTMPWLQFPHATRIQQQKLRRLFDTAQSKNSFEKELAKLMELQKEDGGLSWFKGGRTDDFISAYVLAGLGKMQQDHLLDPDIATLKTGYPEFLNRLISFADNQLVSPTNWADPIDFLYARSSWLKGHPFSSSANAVADSVLKAYWKNIYKYGIDRQATLIIISLRFAGVSNSYREPSIRQLESIRQLAISDSVNGMRWKAVSNSDDLDWQDEETVARITEAFETAGKGEEVVSGIVKWLLKTKSEHIWTNTKATAAIVGLLPAANLSGETHTLSAITEDSLLTVTDDLFNGTTNDYLNLSGEKFPSAVSIKSDNSRSVSGGIKYYYFSSSLPNDTTNAVVRIQKSLFRYDATSENWAPVMENTVLRIADKIKTVLTINTSRQIKYVFINDRRAAAMEPKEVESGYQYEEGLDYYQSVKDAGYLFFVDKIPSGIHRISYETVLTASGNFTNGPASIQCMYQPFISGYSNMSVISINP